MSWFSELLFHSSIAHSILVLAVAIAAGIWLGKIKIFGVSLGMTFVLFVGIVLGHFGFTIPPEVLHFFRDFGLILFVFAVGMQVGPGFFTSFRKGGMTLNLLATAIIGLGAGITVALHYATGIPMATMVGVMSGAVTNTPGLGAAQQSFTDLFGKADPTIAMGYAVAYPLGVVGIILSMLVIRRVFRIRHEVETEEVKRAEASGNPGVQPVSLVVKNPALFNRPISDLERLLKGRTFVVSRICYQSDNRIDIARGDTLLREGDKIFVITTQDDAEAIKAFVGDEAAMDRKQWMRAGTEFVSRRILVTKAELNGKRLGDLQLRQLHSINITRITRSGVEFVANPAVNLQLGDRLTIVGSETSVNRVADILGNSLKRLDQPNLIPIFVGIALGIVLGSIPLAIPGIPQPIKLGLAGGPLIVAILLSKFGYRYKLITYTTQSANLMLREVGIALFLACVGLGAGDGFVATIAGGGWAWIGYGFLITVVPLLVVGIIARRACRLNYFTLQGLLAGSTTDPPALAYSNASAGNDVPAVSYATVYPLTMFLRVVAAQLLVLFFYS